MKRALLVSALLCMVGAVAVAGAATSLTISTKRVDAFGGSQAATSPATPSSCTTATPAPMTAPPADFYVSTSANQLHQYSYDATTFAFTQVGSSALNAANSTSVGVAATSRVYVANSSNQAIYRYNLDRTFAAVLPGTLSPGGISVRGLAVDEVNDELWIADRQGSNSRLRCYVLSSLVSGSGPISAIRTISVAGTDPQGLAIDGTNLYVVDGTSKRLYQALRTSANNTNATQGNVMVMTDAPRGLELKSGVLFVAGTGSKIYRFPDLSLFFTGTANVTPSPSSPTNLSHTGATGL